jgi:23S rRNA (cytidine1920-2'-O)/16S rRNA (cytidine1409-2'-O)-methyltransferase
MSPRADERLVELGLVASRARAQSEIKAGTVTIGGRAIQKPSERVAPEAALELARADNPWVSRGGLKLAHGLDHFAIDPAGAIALDLGASTGGFTQVLLERGTARVYAVDVGHDQLHQSLRGDTRVVVLERANARHLDRTLVPEPIDLVVADVSFISLRLVLPPALALAQQRARLVVLVKPQFEVGPGGAPRGIVRDPAVRAAAVRNVAELIAAQPGWSVLGETPSPIRGGDGNEEVLLAAERS